MPEKQPTIVTQDGSIEEHTPPQGGVEKFLSQHPALAEAARNAALLAALLGTGANQETRTDPATSGSEDVVTAYAHKDPAAVEAYILTELPNARDPDTVEGLLKLLRGCPSCGEESDIRSQYVLTLFDRLSPYDTLLLSDYTELIASTRDRKYVITRSIRELTKTMERYELVIPATFDNYASIFTDTELADIIVDHLVRFPVSFAHSLGTRPEIRTLLRSEEDRLRARFTDLDIAYENISADTLAELTSTYGEKATATLLAVWENESKDVLHGVTKEITKAFDISTIEQLFVDDHAVTTNPYALLAILHEHESTEDAAVSETLRLQAIDHIKTYPYPQVTLREAETLFTYLGDRTNVFSTLIIDAMQRCVSDGSYRALNYYHDRYAHHLEGGWKEFLNSILSDATSAAYDAGDFTAFDSLYQRLDPVEKSRFEKKRDAMRATESVRVRDETRERYGLELDPQLPFDPSHLPFPRSEMERYLTRLVRRSIDATTLQGEGWALLGKGFTRYYGHSFISIPIDDLKGVLFHEEFGQALASTDMQLSYANVFMLAENVHRTVAGAKEKTSVGKAARETLRILREHRHDVVIGPGVKTIIAAHAEESFDPEVLQARLHEGSGGFENDVLFSGKGMRLEGGVNVVKRGLLKTIANTRKGPTTIILSGHGLPTHIELDSNRVPAAGAAAVSPNEITYQELGDALMRAKNPEMRVMVFACHSYDFLHNLTAYITRKGGTLPVLQVAETNEDRIGFYIPKEDVPEEKRVGFFDHNQVLDAIIQHLYEKNGQGLTVEDLQKLQGELLMSHAIKVMLRDVKKNVPAGTGSGQKHKNDAKKEQRSQTGKVLEIVGTEDGADRTPIA